MKLSEMEGMELNEELINKVLYDIPKDDGKVGDCIWVFGSKNFLEERVNVAFDLYKKKRAPYILLSGGLGKTGTIPEASIMKEQLLAKGVPEEDILYEEESNNTTENVLCALLVLERKFLLQNIKRLIIVSSPGHIQRLQLTLSRYMPKWIEYSFCYDDNSPSSKENWMKTEDMKEKVIKEANGIIYYAKHGYIDDKEIEV